MTLYTSIIDDNATSLSTLHPSFICSIQPTSLEQTLNMPAPTFSETTTELPLPSLNKHIAKNAAWATSFEADHPGLFEKLSQGQQPQILWFGCEFSLEASSPLADEIVALIRLGQSRSRILGPGQQESWRDLCS